MVQRATDRIVALPSSGDAQQYALDVLMQLLPLDPHSRAELEVNIALVAEAPALPELVTIRNHAYQQLGEGCTRLVELLTGRPRDEHILHQARRLHALIEGLALHLLMQFPSEDSVWAIEILREELARIASETST
ncbi:TetR family transcriptional regulator C-terminal domain-containing protein [Kocuria sp. SM24M-10]|uniref:TetR family transcriptional regulator C-terminal domain-containing protein n=1 Tax=Kocuria sp. SM24M-10 TaxID=1660349 RepID=UPI000699CD87|nr:TetR family transcriptional regulator C-terminal domain-containing protein [Kocuria sp. SM24M-10]